MRTAILHLFKFFLVSVALVLASCGGGDHGGGGTPGKRLASIAITPATATIPLGGTQQYSARGTYSDGSSANVSSGLTWSSSASDVASISATGLASSVATGTVTVTASSGGVSGTATLTIGAPALTTITINPTSNSVALGSTQQFAATGRFTDGHTEDITSAATWTSSDPLVATVLNTAGRSGLSVPKGAGTTTVKAQSGSVSDSATLTVFIQHSHFLYATEHDNVSTYVVNDATGDLRALRNLRLSAAEELTLHPNGKFAFVTSTNSVLSFGLNQTTGELTKVSEAFANEAAYNPVVHPSGKFLYLPTLVKSELFAYSIDAAGSLALLPGYPMSDFENIVFDPSGKFAYGLTAIPNSLRAYKVDDATGALSYTAGYAPGTAAIALAIDPAGQFLYVANNLSHDISAYSINPVSGALTELQGSPFSAIGQNPVDIEVDPSGRYLFVLCRGSKEVRSFEIADEGTLTAASSGAVSALASRLTLDPSGTTVYVAVNNGIEIARLEFEPNTGTMTQLRPMRTLGPPFSVEIARGQDAPSFTAKTLYVTNVGDGTISAFPVNASSGTVSSATSYPSSGNATAIAVDPSGSYLYVANWWDNRVSGFSIDPTTSALATLASSPYDSGVTPFGLLFDPFGRYLYTASWDQLAMFTFDQSNGGLNNIYTQTATTSVQGLASGGGGHFIYVLGAGSVAGFRVQSTGVAAPVQWTPITLDLPVMGSYARALTVDPTGNYLYVAITGYGNDSTTLLAFSINSLNGELTPILGSPFTTGRNPISLATDTWGRYLYVGYQEGLQAFKIDPPTGALHSVGNYPLPGYVLSLWADPSGGFLYAGVGGAAQLRAYRIDAATGTLTEVTGSPFSGVNEPWSIAGTVISK